MTYKEARKLRRGDLVIQKMHGYIMSVESVSEHTDFTGNKYININCRLENGNLLKCKHKEVIKKVDNNEV